MENSPKHPGGRPRKYAEGPGRYSITLSPADKDLVEKFLLWVQFHLGKRMGVAEVLLEGVRRSPLFTEFVRVTGYTPGRPSAEPASLPLFTEEPEPAPNTPDGAAEMIPEPVKAAPVEPAKAPEPVPVSKAPNAEGTPDEAAVLELVKAARDAGKDVKGIARGAGVDLTMLYKALKGDRHLTPEARRRLFGYLKG